MSNPPKSMYRQTITRLTAGIPVSDADARAAVYERMRAANERIIAKNAGSAGENDAIRLRGILEDAIAEHERELHATADGEPSFELNLDEEEVARDLAASEQEVAVGTMPGATVSNPPLAGNNFTPAPRQSEKSGWLPGLLVGIVLSAACVAAAWWFGAISFAAAPPVNPRIAEFERRYAVQLPQVKVAATFLDQVEKEVQRLQKDPKAITLAAKALVPLEKLAPTLAAAMPKTLPYGTKLLVRADAKNYKIIYLSRLCSTVQFARPELIDPKRATDGLGCTYFGKWSAGGKSF